MKSPVYNVKPIAFERIIGTAYTTNEMTDSNLDLLYKIIKDDGYTTPIVCYYDKVLDLYCIIDGHYRYRVMRDHPDIYERENGMLPVCIIDKTEDALIISNYRHNIAKGIPNVYFTSKLIKRLISIGKSDEYIKKKLNISEEHLRRFKDLKDFSDYFLNEET